ncbi:MAG: polysaccharide biosynthesis C-terminal domain-containing protein [Oscillospiraceae bacterium]|nr:polysaccharide biosynthesis C-terminal domain-containing protein [Oscillospiraceae bacterium]
MKKQGFLYGSAVLMVSALLVKVLGALFKIPLANMLGGRGMGYFSAAYSIFMPIYAISVTGLPAAAAKCTAEAMERDGERGALAVKSVGLRLFGLVGLVSALVIMFASYPFCKYAVGDIYAFPAAAVIAPSVLAGCLVSVYRGYYEGLRNMYPTAVSQVIEGAVKLFFGLFLCWGTLYLAQNKPTAFLRLIGCENRNIDPAAAAVPYSAAAAVAGITLSTFGGLFWIMAHDRRHIPKNSRKGLDANRKQRAEIRLRLVKIALPAAVGALVINLTSLIDLVTVMGSLKNMTERSPEIFSELTRAGISLADVPNFIYGSFTGLAITLFNLVPALTNMFGKSILPAAAAAKAAGDRRRLGECSRNALLAAALVSFPAGAGLTAMARPLLQLLFGSKDLEIAVCSDSMAVLGLAVPFVCLSQTAFSLLQAADRADIPVKIMGLSAAVKLILNLLLTPVKGLGVTGAAIATLACYMLICGLSAEALKKHGGFDSKGIIPDFVKIGAGSLFCGAGAVMMNASTGTGEICVILSCGFGAAVYFGIVIITGAFSRNTVKMLLKD